MGLRGLVLKSLSILWYRGSLSPDLGVPEFRTDLFNGSRCIAEFRQAELADRVCSNAEAVIRCYTVFTSS